MSNEKSRLMPLAAQILYITCDASPAAFRTHQKLPSLDKNLSVFFKFLFCVFGKKKGLNTERNRNQGSPGKAAPPEGRGWRNLRTAPGDRPIGKREFRNRHMILNHTFG
uniref:Uncharacterized protein n=1 Tax=Cyanoptyche gloeocystis TaxID=77922 RepID=A0A7S2JJE6_9EUKA